MGSAALKSDSPQLGSLSLDNVRGDSVSQKVQLWFGGSSGKHCVATGVAVTNSEKRKRTWRMEAVSKSMEAPLPKNDMLRWELEKVGAGNPGAPGVGQPPVRS